MKNVFFGSQEKLLQKLHHSPLGRTNISPQSLDRPQPNEGEEEAAGPREQDLRGLPSTQKLSLASWQSWLFFIL